MGKIDWSVDAMVAQAAVAVVGGVVETAEAARTHAADNTPVDTGFLRASWGTGVEVRGTQVVGRLYNDAPYAPFVNDGTSKMRGRFMLQGAVAAEFPKVSERIARRLS